MRIGELARTAGVTVDAVRFYERRGVLPAPARRASGYRVYTPATLERLRFVKLLQGLGFTLDEVTDGLRAVDRGDASCERDRWRAERVIARLDEKIAELARTRARLAAALADCGVGQCAPVKAAARTSVSPRSK